jgi:hypothetical protein
MWNHEQGTAAGFAQAQNIHGIPSFGLMSHRYVLGNVAYGA